MASRQRQQNRVARPEEIGSPEILTINDKAELVLQDAESYQALLDRLRAAEDLAAIRQGLAQAERGEGTPAGEVLAHLKRKYGL